METHAINSITQNHQDEELLSKNMQVFFRSYQVGRILRAANAYKLRGIPVLSIFLPVFRMVFQQRLVYTQMHLQSTAMPLGKDTFYRFMNACRIHWRRCTTEIAAAIIYDTLAPLTHADRIVADGSGLGLAIVHRIIAALGGSVHADRLGGRATDSTPFRCHRMTETDAHTSSPDFLPRTTSPLSARIDIPRVAIYDRGVGLCLCDTKAGGNI